MLRHELQLRLKLNLNLLLKNQIELLIHPTQELEQLLKEEKEANPFIEEVVVRADAKEFFEERWKPEQRAKYHPLEILQKNLKAELEGLELQIALELVSCTDERGFFRGSVREIASRFGVPENYVEDLREFITTVEPIGVCSKDVYEFLKLQAKEFYPEDEELLEFIDKLKEGTEPPQRIKARLRTLRLAPVEENVAPFRIGRVDAIIELDDGHLVGHIYEELIDIKLSRTYMEIFSKVKGEARAFLKKYAERYENLKKVLSLRKENLRKILNIIMEVQEPFLKGEGNLRTLLVKDVANRMGISESTVSRLINSKYVRTPQGTYPFRFFFVRETVGGISQEELMREIKNIVSEEDPRRPLSDEEIAKILKEKGYDVARRTVAKYRDLLGIPSSRQRRQR